jgi:arylsulfatase A-like enzyme
MESRRVLGLLLAGLVCVWAASFPWVVFEAARMWHLGHEVHRPAFFAAVLVMYAVASAPAGLLLAGIVAALQRRFTPSARETPGPALVSVVLPTALVGWGALLAVGYANVTWLPGPLQPRSLLLDAVVLGVAALLAGAVARALLRRRLFFGPRVRTLGRGLGVGVVLVVAAAAWLSRDAGGPIRQVRAAARPDGETASPLPNVLLVSIDTLRADHLGCYGYPRRTSPFIDGLAGEGALFRQSLSQASWTRASAASLLTSLYPSTHGTLYMTAALAPGTPTLAAYLSARGYRTAVFSANTNVSTTFGFGQGVHEFYESLRPRLLQRTLLFETLMRAHVPTRLFLLGQVRDNARGLDDDRSSRDRWVVRQFGGWMARAAPGPFFAYVHLMGVHAPYRPPPPYDRAFGSGSPDPASANPPDAAGNVMERGRAVPEAVRQAMIDGYDGLVLFADDNVRTLVGALRDAGRLDDTVVIVTADHGEAFWDHGIWGHGGSLYEAEVRVPLVLWAGPRVRERHPRIPRGPIEVPAAGIDVMPTLLALAGADCPSCQGEDLLRLAERGERERPILLEQYMSPRSYTYAVRDSRHKLVYTDFLHGRITRWELFDLTADPGEARNQLAGPPTPAPPLATALRSLREEALARRGAVAHVELTRDPAVYEELKALGYVK